MSFERFSKTDSSVTVSTASVAMLSLKLQRKSEGSGTKPLQGPPGRYGIKYFSTNSYKKAAVVERFNRTLKTAMWKYFYAKGIYNWTNALDQLVSNYITALNIAPSSRSQEMSTKRARARYGPHCLAPFCRSPLPKFKVDDMVRISKYKSIFTKGYEANFTEELFKIAKVIRGDPNVYEL